MHAALFSSYINALPDMRPDRAAGLIPPGRVHPTMEPTIDVLEKAMRDYPGMDGRGLQNVRVHGRVVGYSKWGNRQHVHRVLGTRTEQSHKYYPMPTRTEIELPDWQLREAREHFHAWLRKHAWYTPGVRFDVVDDTCFHRVEYRLWTR